MEEVQVSLPRQFSLPRLPLLQSHHCLLSMSQEQRKKKKKIKCQTTRRKFNYLSPQSCLQVKESRSIDFAVMWPIKCFSFMVHLCEDFYFPEIYGRIHCIMSGTDKKEEQGQ